MVVTLAFRCCPPSTPTPSHTPLPTHLTKSRQTKSRQTDSYCSSVSTQVVAQTFIKSLRTTCPDNLLWTTCPDKLLRQLWCPTTFSDNFLVRPIIAEFAQTTNKSTTINQFIYQLINWLIYQFIYHELVNYFKASPMPPAPWLLACWFSLPHPPSHTPVKAPYHTPYHSWQNRVEPNRSTSRQIVVRLAFTRWRDCLRQEVGLHAQVSNNPRSGRKS